MMVEKVTSTILALLFIISTAFSQTLTADFEDLNLPPDSFYNGADFAGQYMTGGITFPINYDTAGGFSSWSGFAYSNLTDTSTPGFINQYSCYAGEGYNGSATYGIYFSLTNDSINFPFDIQLPGFYISNNTYAALSMRDGDAFAKQFGGPNGTDPDYFRIRFQGFDANSNFLNEVVFYLADYRSADSTQDYIVKDWTFVDLSGLGSIRSFAIVFESSDTGTFGVNTPKYFCLDNFQLTVPTSIGPEPVRADFEVFPNPVESAIRIQLTEYGEQLSQFNLYDSSARLVKSFQLEGVAGEVDLSNIPTGVYYLHRVGSESQPQQLIKQ